MRDLRLGDRQVQQALSHFVTEARKSVETQRDDGEGGVLGLAAMTTILACICAIGEAIKKERVSTTAAIGAFYDAMVEKERWISPPPGLVHDDDQILKLLANVRNALAHSLTLPSTIVLVAHPLTPRDRPGDAAYPNRWRLSITEFIDAVEETIRQVSESSPELPWDPGKREDQQRSPVVTRRRYPSEFETELWDTL